MTGKMQAALLAVVTALVMALAASVALGGSYMSRSEASKITEKIARRQHANGLIHAVNCWPTGRQHTQRNLRYRWSRWDCGWTLRWERNDGTFRCSGGKFRITGTRHGSKYRTLHSAHCGLVAKPTPAPLPTPAAPTPAAPTPAPPKPAAPAPAPSGISARQQQMIERAISDGIGYATRLVQNGSGGGSSFFYYGQMNRPDCLFLNVRKVSCPLYLWSQVYNTDNVNPGIEHVTREIFRAFVFEEDLGTSVGFNFAIEPSGVLAWEPNRPWQMLCSDWYNDAEHSIQPCPGVLSVTYPTDGRPPYPNPT
jgi:hypothetical protein